jgi:hypothetical protein
MSKFVGILNTILVLVVLVLGYLLYSQNQRIEELENKKYVNISNSIPDNVLADIEIMKNRITEIQRVGPDSVYVIEQYVPHESEVHYVATVDEFTWNQLMDIKEQLTLLQASGDTTGLAELEARIDSLRYNLFQMTVDFDTHGFCLEPVVGGSVNESANGEIVIGARLGYWNRYGIGLHGTLSNFHPTDMNDTEYGLGGFVDGRIPNFENVGAFLGGGYNFTREEWNTRIGLQGYLN